MEIIDFNAVIENTEQGRRSILLGNGFSRAWSNRTFSYENLKEEVQFKGVGQGKANSIKRLFDDLETYDFEKVMHAMELSIHVARSRHESHKYPVFVDSIISDIEMLKRSLADVIAAVHPALPSEITDDQYVCVRNFLSRFSNIYTVNYDLLLYWARNKDRLDPVGYRTDDGFRQGAEWVGEEVDQEVFFLHGALHLYFDGTSVFKRVYGENLGTLRDQIMEGLRKNEFPLFVAEPTARKKLQSIKSNPYLNFCFNKLNDIRGSLVIYGHSMNETDEHIFKMINNSAVEDIYVSIFGDVESEDSQSIIADARRYFYGHNVVFYDAMSTPVWELPKGNTWTV